MQTDTADASNLKQKLQHWTSKNQSNKKKQVVNDEDTFQENPSKKKKKRRKNNTDTIEVKSASQCKIHNSGKYGRERKASTLERYAQQDFRRGSAGQAWEVRNKEMQKGKEIHGREERVEGCGGSMLEEEPGADMLNRILGGEVRDKHGKYGIRKCRRERQYMGRRRG